MQQQKTFCYCGQKLANHDKEKCNKILQERGEEIYKVTCKSCGFTKKDKAKNLSALMCCTECNPDGFTGTTQGWLWNFEKVIKMRKYKVTAIYEQVVLFEVEAKNKKEALKTFENGKELNWQREGKPWDIEIEHIKKIKQR